MELDQNRYMTRSKTHHDSGKNRNYIVKGKKLLNTQLSENYHKKGKGALYIHIPYCNKICTFCTMRRSLRVPDKDYADLIVKQIENYSKYKYIRDSKYDAIYFGGGTPTTLETTDLKKILGSLKNNFNLTEDCEVTIETTVTELDDDKMVMLYEQGVNRFSIGVQTFSNRGRKVLGRLGDSEHVIKRLEKLKQIGFSNINIDIIYNYPEETLDNIVNDMNLIKALDISGFSFYSLIINRDAKMKKMISNSQEFYKKNYEREKVFFQEIVEQTINQGYKYLELTKIVKPDRDKYKYITRKHEREDIVPIGAGAGGYIGNSVLMNPIDMNMYRESIQDIGNICCTEMNEKYDKVNFIVGQVQMGKIDVSMIEDEKYKECVCGLMDELEKENFVKKDADIYNLTSKGIFWGNNISKEISDLTVKL